MGKKRCIPLRFTEKGEAWRGGVEIWATLVQFDNGRIVLQTSLGLWLANLFRGLLESPSWDALCRGDIRGFNTGETCCRPLVSRNGPVMIGLIDTNNYLEILHCRLRLSSGCFEWVSCKVRRGKKEYACKCTH